MISERLHDDDDDDDDDDEIDDDDDEDYDDVLEQDDEEDVVGTIDTEEGEEEIDLDELIKELDSLKVDARIIDSTIAATRFIMAEAKYVRNKNQAELKERETALIANDLIISKNLFRV